MEEDLLVWLQNWYHQQCDGDWEHQKNIIIETIDNPGWSVTINLENTNLQNKEFSIFDKNYSESNWIYCFVENNKFEGRCDSKNLIKILKIFKDWSDLQIM